MPPRWWSRTRSPCTGRAPSACSRRSAWPGRSTRSPVPAPTIEPSEMCASTVFSTWFFAVDTAKNHVENPVDAHISDGSMVGAGTSISVAARDGGTIVAVAGHLALATAKPTSGAVAVGISISTNTMHNTISAYVNHATADAPAVAVTTTEDADITAVSIGGEHPDGFAVGASGSNNELTNNLEARVSGGAVVTATTASITAADDGTIVAISGNFGLAERFEAVGGA